MLALRSTKAWPLSGRESAPSLLCCVGMWVCGWWDREHSIISQEATFYRKSLTNQPSTNEALWVTSQGCAGFHEGSMSSKAQPVGVISRHPTIHEHYALTEFLQCLTHTYVPIFLICVGTITGNTIRFYLNILVIHSSFLTYLFS